MPRSLQARPAVTESYKQSLVSFGLTLEAFVTRTQHAFEQRDAGALDEFRRQVEIALEQGQRARDILAEADVPPAGSALHQTLDAGVELQMRGLQVMCDAPEDSGVIERGHALYAQGRRTLERADTLLARLGSHA